MAVGVGPGARVEMGWIKGVKVAVAPGPLVAVGVGERKAGPKARAGVRVGGEVGGAGESVGVGEEARGAGEPFKVGVTGAGAGAQAAAMMVPIMRIIRRWPPATE